MLNNSKIEMSCPACKARAKLSVERINHRVACPACGVEFIAQIVAQIEPKPSPDAGTASREIVDLLRICAVYDKPYITTVERGPNGWWRLLKTTRTNGEAGINGPPGDATQLIFDPASPREACAWCGTPSRGPETPGGELVAVKCIKCGDAICLGRMEGMLFHCRESCGAAGEVSGRIKIEGTPRREAATRAEGSATMAAASTKGALQEPLRASPRGVEIINPLPSAQENLPALRRKP